MNAVEFANLYVAQLKEFFAKCCEHSELTSSDIRSVQYYPTIVGFDLMLSTKDIRYMQRFKIDRINGDMLNGEFKIIKY